MGKGFGVAHQKASINIGLNGKIHGITEITINPTSPDLKTVWLNARDCNIISTALRLPTPTPLAFSHLPPARPRLAATGDIHSYPALKRAVWSSTNEGEEGELGIALPPICLVKVIPPESEAVVEKDKKVKDEWEQITIVIEYEVLQPGEGIAVVGPDEANPSRFPHVFTVASNISARTWLPCSDALWDRCTWDLEFIVPRVLYSSTPTVDQAALDDANAGDGDNLGEWPISVVASGDLIEQVVHPTRSDRVIWHYMLATPVSAQQIAWAVGPFVVTELAGAAKDRGEDDFDDEVVDDGGIKVHALCLPGRESEMAHSVGVVRKAMDFYTTTFGSYPFSSYTVAFVDSLNTGAPTFHSAAMTLFSSDLLHPPSIIDQAYESRHLLAHALAFQWSGVNLIPRLPSDTWLTTGIALHITSMFIRALWGNNEFRFRLKKDMIRCVAQDVQREPICVQARATPHEPEQLQFIALKAPLVLHILDKHLRKAGTSLGLEKVLPKLFLDAITGDLGSGITLNTVSTSSFLRTCRKTCGGSLDVLKQFFDQWVYGSGCPTFLIEVNFNRKKMAIELNVTQECLAANWSKSAPWEECSHTRPIELFEGQLSIRIHEADGTPYEHVLNIGEKFKRHEVPFNTKYKRVRRNTKRYQARQAAATAAALGDAEAQEDMGMVDIGFSLNLWEEEVERDKWRVADWTEEDDVVMSQATYEWIRVDADLEWICGISFEQPDFMWLSQLQRDRDVVAQLEAVHALSRMPSPIVSSNLAKTVLVTNYFFRVRMEAALALISCATQAQAYLGLFHLLKIFQSRYCFDPDVETMDPFAFRCIPKTNDFTDMTEYFLKKTLLTAISMVRDEKGQTPPVVQQFLIDLLAFTDNLSNKFSDVFYVTALISASSHALVATAPLEHSEFIEELQTAGIDGVALPLAIQEAQEEIERYMSTDRLVPSYHNAITVAGIEWKIKLMLANLIPVDLTAFFSYTREGNYPSVRIAAFDALLLLGTIDTSETTRVDHRPLVAYFFAVIEEDSSLLVRRRLAQSMLHSLPVLIAVGDLAAPVKKGLVFEEHGKKAKVSTDMDDAVLKPLRNAVGRQNRYREALLGALHAELDSEILHCLLKLCENTIKPKGEPFTKLVIRVPVPATVESPAPVAVEPASTKIRFNTGPSTQHIPKITIPFRALTPLDNSIEPIGRFTELPSVSPIKIKIKEPRPRETTGLSMPDLKACQSVLKKLFNSKISVMFRTPVDPVKSGAPGYFDIVAVPMDLSTMQYKLLGGHYMHRDEFRSDLKLIVANAETYNISGIVVDQAHELDAVFEKQWGRVLKTLEGLTRQFESNGRDYHASQSTSLTKISIAAPVSRRPSPPPPMEADYYPPAVPIPAAPSGIKLRLGGSHSATSTPPPPLPPPPPSEVLPIFQQSTPLEPTIVAYTPPVEPVPPPVAPVLHVIEEVDQKPYLEPVVAPPPPPAPISFKFKLKAPAPPTATPSPAPQLNATPALVPSYINLVPPPPLAPVAAPAPKSTGFKLKFNTSASNGTAPVVQPVKVHKPPKIRTFEEDIDEMLFTEPKPKISTHKKSKPVVSYVDEPSPPPQEPEDTETVYPAAGQPAILNEPKLPYPSQWFKESDPINLKKAKAVMKKMSELPESFFFRDPVEAVGGLAMYYQEIKSPMDLRTLGRRLDSGALETYRHLFSTFDLIVGNCKQFNPPHTEPVWHVEVMDRAWRAEWEKQSKMTPREKIAMGSLLKQLMKEGAAYPFLQPLDPIAAGVPQYYDIIPKENCRDITTIQKKLAMDRYESIEAVEADLVLMIDNCMAFNDPSSPVAISGAETEKIFEELFAKHRAGSGGMKRGASDGGGSLVVKKVKY